VERIKGTKDHFPGEKETILMYLTQYFIMSLKGKYYGVVTLLGCTFILLIRKISQCSFGQFLTFSVTPQYFVEGLRRIKL
jgi:hypothetical protein